MDDKFCIPLIFILKKSVLLACLLRLLYILHSNQEAGTRTGVSPAFSFRRRAIGELPGRKQGDKLYLMPTTNILQMKHFMHSGEPYIYKVCL